MKNEGYKKAGALGKTRSEKYEILQDIIKMYETEHKTLDEIAEYYGVTRQAISLKLRKAGYKACNEIQHIKRKDILDTMDERNKSNFEELYKKFSAMRVNYINYKKRNKELRKQIEELERTIEFLNSVIKSDKMELDEITIEARLKAYKDTTALLEQKLKEMDDASFCTDYEIATKALERDVEVASDMFYDVGRYDTLNEIKGLILDKIM